MIQTTEEILFKIVNKAMTIYEIIESNCISKKANISIVDSKIKEWCQTSTQGDWERFEQRLTLDSLDLAQIRSAFNHTLRINNHNIPAWAETLHEVIKIIRLFSTKELENNCYEKYPFINAQDPIPFEEIFLPFIYIAEQKLITCTGSNYHILSEKAHASLKRSLLKRLSNLCSSCLQSEFLVFCALKESQIFSFNDNPQNNLSKDAYNKFINKMLCGGLLSFFKEYSVLARLAATITELWVDSTREFILRLTSDWDEIQAIFEQDNKKLGQVISVEPSMSDYHSGGRSVIALKFDSGLNLVYKPRNLDIEYEFFDFISWINRQGELLNLKSLKVLKKSTYGWIEFVNHIFCQNEAQLSRFYLRAGMLLCLIHVLQGTDFHYENIIACGDYPVLFDLETLFQNTLQESNNSNINLTSTANSKIRNSVLFTHLLPNWEYGIKGQSFDISGLGGVGDQETYFKIIKFKNINTDQMTANHDYGKTLTQNNLPLLKSPEFLLSSYVDKIVDGFQQMYNFLVKHRERLLAVNSPLEKLAHQKVRFISRTTGNYLSILNNSLNPKFVRNGIDRSIYLDTLNRDLFLSNSKSNLWPLLKAEYQALEYMDIPIFTSYPNSNDLTIDPNRKIDNFFARPSFDRVIDCLNNLNEKDLEKQVNFIKGAVYSRIASKTKQMIGLISY